VHCENPYIFVGTTCPFVKAAKLLLLLVIWPPSWISTSHDIGSSTTVRFDPENMGVAIGILSLCVLEL